ncbi:hypothetical protein ACFVIL_29280 [Streptomyces sp. NPDC127159]|uniref:hypothetical protein n=1 Tax=unclassified Streptomyces TaxID=2593676 RepID=UPI00363D660B
MTEEWLDQDELTARCWAVLAAVAEGRHEDVDELLVTLPWDDLVTVVCGIGSVAVGALAGPTGLDKATARERVADAARRLLMERIAKREGPPDDAP